MRFLGLLPLFACLLVLLPARAAEPVVVAIIVPQTHAGGGIATTELSLIFLRKKLYWKNGQRIQPVNLSSDNPLRRVFSHEVLGSLPESQTEYWNIQYYHGISPPYVVDSQEAMLRFVAETEGAIGYVDACKADNRVKVIAWISESGLSLSKPQLDCPN
jgi:hypothetical protein